MTTDTTEAVEDTFTALREILVESLGVDADKIQPEKSLGDDLGCDSLDAVEIAMAAEDKFGVEIPDDEMTHQTTVQDFVALIERLKAEKA